MVAVKCHIRANRVLHVYDMNGARLMAAVVIKYGIADVKREVAWNIRVGNELSFDEHLKNNSR